MDKSWMRVDRRSQRYLDGIEAFFKFASDNGINTDFMFCPCLLCHNLFRYKQLEVKNHIVCHGIDQSYVLWLWHGEKLDCNVVSSRAKRARINDGDVDNVGDIGAMFGDADDRFVGRPDDLTKTLEEAEKYIYPRSTVTKMSFLVRMYNLKARCGFSYNGFFKLLVAFADFLSKDNDIPKCMYEAKNFLHALGMEYEKIHACPNDCMLYRNNHRYLTHYHVCESSSWKKNSKGEDKVGIPAKVLWYIPLIPRFFRLFRNKKHARSLVWHEEERIKDGKLCHPVDSPAWKDVDKRWSEIGNDGRNLRLGLSADGINPHSSLSSKYSCWPVILADYNLHPWLFMK